MIRFLALLAEAIDASTTREAKRAPQRATLICSWPEGWGPSLLFYPEER